MTEGMPNLAGEGKIKSSEGNEKIEMKTHRDYDWQVYIPEDIPEFYSTQNELKEIEALVETREKTGKLPRFLLGGPSGSGKTHLAMYIAQKYNMPMFVIQCKWSLDESSLLGRPIIVRGETVWQDGPLTKALLCSQQRPTVLLLDEVNRARPEAKSVLYSALDHRCRVELDARGGEVIEGKSLDLISFATMNEGRGHFTEELDEAEKRRLGNRWNTTYLGENDPEKEVELLINRADIPEKLSVLMVRTANDVRKLAEDIESPVEQGISTGSLIEWAKTARSFSKKGIENSVVTASTSSVVKPFYEGNAEEVVKEAIKSYLNGAPTEEKEFEEWLTEE